MNAKEFVIDYIDRHKHPVNACLHIVGVPAAFAGFYFLVAGRAPLGASLVAGGYFLQYLGHKAQGNEVGEVTLIKHIYARLTGKQKGERGDEGAPVELTRLEGSGKK